MLQGLLGFKMVGGLAQFLRREVVVIGNPVDQLHRLISQRDALRHNGVELGAVTGRENNHFIHPGGGTGIGQGLTDLLRGKGHPLAHLDGGRVVVDSQGDQFHSGCVPPRHDSYTVLAFPAGGPSRPAHLSTIGENCP